MVRQDEDEHRCTHHHPGGKHVHEERTSHTPDSALAELRRKLEGGLAKAGLKKTELAAQTGLSRTTVQQAFQTDGPSPSAPTVTALAGALRLPVEELQALQRVAADGGTGIGRGPVGRSSCGIRMGWRSTRPVPPRTVPARWNSGCCPVMCAAGTTGSWRRRYGKLNRATAGCWC
ncbi:helix-turn-helix domain-containing protein [Streptomyces sp. NBC_01450]|nr:helix-turn-helix transcriptional regulator [Streptomyces sp. NBC_01450]